MRNYTRKQSEEKISEILELAKCLSSEIDTLYSERKDLRFFQIGQKKIIDAQILSLREARYIANIACMMFMLYMDSINNDSTGGLSIEELIRIENEARLGDGHSKLLIFCHSAFIENDLRDRDLKRLKMEANEGDRASVAILMCYRTYFE